MTILKTVDVWTLTRLQECVDSGKHQHVVSPIFGVCLAVSKLILLRLPCAYTILGRILIIQELVQVEISLISVIFFVCFLCLVVVFNL